MERIIASGLDQGLLTALAGLAPDLGRVRGPWWVIGSAAAALHGARGLAVGDIDLLMSAGDARRVLAARGVASMADGGVSVFRSEVFGSWDVPPLKAEVLANFDLFVDGAWRRVAPRTRIEIATPVGAFFVPAREELIALYAGFGRPKDAARIRALEAIQPFSAAIM